MKVLSVASEVFPLIKTGGLADVAGALPAALKPKGIEMVSLMPGYPTVMAALEDPTPVHLYQNLYGGAAGLVRGKAKGLDVLVLDAPHLFDRPGNPYLGPDGKDWPDNGKRFAALSRAASDIGEGKVKGFMPDILHLHDWQAALAAANIRYASSLRKPKTLLTVHNIAFQGSFGSQLFGDLGLPAHAYAVDGVGILRRHQFSERWLGLR